MKYIVSHGPSATGPWTQADPQSELNRNVEGLENGVERHFFVRSKSDVTGLISDPSPVIARTPIAGGNPYIEATLGNTGPTVGSFNAPSPTLLASNGGSYEFKSSHSGETFSGLRFDKPGKTKFGNSMTLNFIDCEFDAYGLGTVTPYAFQAQNDSTGTVLVTLNFLRCRFLNGQKNLLTRGGSIIDCQFLDAGADAIFFSRTDSDLLIEHCFLDRFGTLVNTSDGNPHTDGIQGRHATKSLSFRGNTINGYSVNTGTPTGVKTTSACVNLETADGPITGPVNFSFNKIGAGAHGVQFVNDHNTPGGSSHPDYGPVQQMTIQGNVFSDQSQHSPVTSDAQTVLVTGNTLTDGTNIDNLF